MYSNKTPMERLTPEILINLAMHLDVPSVFQLSLANKHFSKLFSDELLCRQLVERDYGINYKHPDETYAGLLHLLYTGAIRPSRYLSAVPDEVTDAKRAVYRASLAHKETANCDLCKTNPAEYLNMDPADNTLVCSSCAQENKQRYAVLFSLSSEGLYTFMEDGSKHKLGDDSADRNEVHKVKGITESLTSNDTINDLDRRRRAEHQLYIQELRREDMSLKHYLIEKTWGRSWMLFRTREGSPLPGRITNQKLARSNGTLDPNIRLPMDKYRPAPETHADIVSEKLWSYLEKAYGVQGRAYSEDDMQTPEYVRLRVYMDDYKKSIHSYP